MRGPVATPYATNAGPLIIKLKLLGEHLHIADGDGGLQETLASPDSLKAHVDNQHY